MKMTMNPILHRSAGSRLALALGLDPATKRYIVVKSMNHFRAGFAPLARQIIYVAAPGALDVDYRRIPYRRVKRPIYPLDP